MRPRGSSFATTVTPVETPKQETITTNGMKNVSAANSQNSCLFSDRGGHTLVRSPQIRKKMRREKIDFLKGKWSPFWMFEGRTHEQRLQ